MVMALKDLVSTTHCLTLRSVESVIENLCKIKFKKYLYISSCQVYEKVTIEKFSKESFKSDIKNK